MPSPSVDESEKGGFLKPPRDIVQPATRGSQRLSKRMVGSVEDMSGMERQTSAGLARDLKDKRGRFVKGTTVLKPPSNDEVGISAIMQHPLNLLLLCLPFGVISYYRKWGDLYVFWLNFAAMIPLAKILGDATEELAANLKNDMLAGLLNATFGNAVEMVITVQTLRAGLFSVVKSTLLGSVLSNILLVLGMSFFCGGIFSMRSEHKKLPQGNYTEVSDRSMDGSRQRPTQNLDDTSREPLEEDSGDAITARASLDIGEKIQSFSVLGALVNTSMLLISCTSFCLITLYRTVLDTKESAAYDTCMEDILLPVSRIASIIIMFAYVAYILFQLVTHKDAMNEGSGDDEDGEDHLSLCKSLVMLFATTIIVAFSSELLVHSIEGVTETAGMSKHFIGIILLPIVGNACEHAAAVRFAMQDKLGLSVSIAIGSSTQIALFVVPFSVLVGWVLRVPMNLNFGMLNTSVMTLSVIVVLSMVVDGHSNWLQGYLLCSVYGVVAVMYWYLPDDMNVVS